MSLEEGVREARMRLQSQKLESLLTGLIAGAKKKWFKMLGFWMGVVVGLWIYGSMGLWVFSQQRGLNGEASLPKGLSLMGSRAVQCISFLLKKGKPSLRQTSELVRVDARFCVKFLNVFLHLCRGRVMKGSVGKSGLLSCIDGHFLILIGGASTDAIGTNQFIPHKNGCTAA